MANKRNIILIILLLLIINTFSIFCTEINVLDIFLFQLPDNVKIIKEIKEIYYEEDNKVNPIMVRFYFKYLMNGKDFSLYIYLRPKKNIILNDLKNTYSLFVDNASSNFGFGDEYENSKKWGVKFTTKNSIKMTKYISSWGGIANDILSYNFDIKHKYFDKCLINFKNIWSLYNDNMPQNLKDVVEEALKKGDKKVEIYRKLDEAMNTLKFINNVSDKNKSITYYSPNINNLRFRNKPTLDGKFIRMLNKGENLELIEKGKTETINGTKGTWVKVKTEKGEIGWCFDAYLDEVKKK